MINRITEVSRGPVGRQLLVHIGCSKRFCGGGSCRGVLAGAWGGERRASKHSAAPPAAARNRGHSLYIWVVGWVVGLGDIPPVISGA